MNDDVEGTPGGQPPEKVEDRPFVGEVTPEDYPLDKRAEENPNGAVDDRTGAGEIQGDSHSSVGAKKDPAQTNPA